ncbi:ATP synthase A1 subunit C [Methanobrevibacter sp. DSM 116169]|uniref:ATP synthase A1 subunit C n=1 Tax=Methanobrevibacter sp. DSM 116169 TaxID=3242727 RepID=UPI0038FC5F66
MADEITTLLETVGITPETFMVLIIIVFVVVGAIIVIITSRPILDIYPYLNPSAKVRARKGRLLTEKQLSEVAEAKDSDEVISYLSGLPDYAPYLEKYPLDKALDVNLADNYKMISRIVPPKVQKPFKIMSKKVDITNIKSLISAKEVGLSADQTRDLLIPSGELYNQLDSVADANSVNDVLAALDGTEYAPVLDDALPRYEENDMVLELESALDNYYLNSLLSSTEVPSEENTQILYTYIGTQIDLAILKTFVRAKQDGLTYTNISPYTLTNGYQLREWKLKDLMEANDISNFVSYLEGTKYSDFLSDALTEYEKTDSIAIFEKELDLHFAKLVKSLSIKKPLGIGPIIGYLNQKESEIRNLKIITRAKKETDYPVSKIMELLV